MKHIISAIEPDSIAYELGIAPGDVLLSVNGQAVRDVLDYRFMIAETRLTVEIEKPDGELWELDIEKEESEDLGLIFDRPLMDETQRCRNKCVFCFIDQLPSGMRETLYVKDDDPRLSFLHGNYITLTNQTPEDIKRIAGYHLSPLRVSVHATDLSIRRRMTGSPNAGGLTDALRTFNTAGIALHFQIVLCKGINDGPVLDDTIRTLCELQPGARSCAVVPVGLTRHREKLFPLEPFGPEDAAAVVRQVARWQRRCKQKFGTAFVFLADEFYLRAGLPLPKYRHYERFPQIENGVGLMALFERQFIRALRAQNSHDGAAKRAAAIVTGRAAAVFMRGLADAYTDAHPDARILIYEVENRFFGPQIDVAGLLTGRDVMDQLRDRTVADGVRLLFLPRSAFRARDPKRKEPYTMLDGTTTAELKTALHAVVQVGSAHGGRFCKQLTAAFTRGQPL